MEFTTIVWLVIAIFIVILLSKLVRIVPTKQAFVVERLGKYQKTLDAGFHLLAPFIDSVAYKHTLKELAIDVPPQICITRDNISVAIDGVLYLRVMDPVKASYGIMDYRFAIIQLAQTTMRSEIGKLDLDVTFESRENINGSIVRSIDEASEPWGIKVTRYEIKNIDPPESIKGAMEKQMRAEREKRQSIALSEGDKIAKINRAEGDKQESIKRSEGEKTRLENEALGKASQIFEVAKATALGLRQIADAINQPGGKEALQLRVAQDYIAAFAELARKNNTMIVPANLTDIAGITTVAKQAFQFTNTPAEPPTVK